METCPKCGGKNIELSQDEVDIGVGTLKGPLDWRCHDCGANSLNFCEFHKRAFERIEDRSEHFEHEHADPFGCPSCYVIGSLS